MVLEMVFEPLFDPASSTWSYLIGDAGIGALVDPVLEQGERDLARVKANGLTLAFVFETHVHADHVSGAGALADVTGATPVVFESSPCTCAARRVKDGERLAIGGLVLEVIHTPGHTPESMSLRLPDRVLTGDSLLIGTCARTDFQNGDPGTLFDSVHEKLFTLPDATRIFPGHDYQGRVCSTIAVEKRTNQRLAGRTRSEFIALMNGLALPKPARMDEAVPANLRLGRA